MTWGWSRKTQRPSSHGQSSHQWLSSNDVLKSNENPTQRGREMTRPQLCDLLIKRLIKAMNSSKCLLLFRDWLPFVSKLSNLNTWPLHSMDYVWTIDINAIYVYVYICARTHTHTHNRYPRQVDLILILRWVQGPHQPRLLLTPQCVALCLIQSSCSTNGNEWRSSYPPGVYIPAKVDWMPPRHWGCIGHFWLHYNNNFTCSIYLLNYYFVTGNSMPSLHPQGFFSNQSPGFQPHST